MILILIIFNLDNYLINKNKKYNSFIIGLFCKLIKLFMFFSELVL